MAKTGITGIFSFNKFIMWNDIHNNAHKTRSQNKIGLQPHQRVEWDTTAEEVDAAYMDGEQLSPANIVLPIIAEFISAGSDL